MLARLKQYKELIAILIFFVSGLYWIESRYTRQDDLAGVNNTLGALRGEMATQADVTLLRCLVTEYMKLTQLQIRAQDLEKEIDRLTEDLSDPRLASADLEGNPALLIVVSDREETLRSAREDLKGVNDEIINVTAALQRSACSENG